MPVKFDDLTKVRDEVVTFQLFGTDESKGILYFAARKQSPDAQSFFEKSKKGLAFGEGVMPTVDLTVGGFPAVRFEGCNAEEVKGTPYRFMRAQSVRVGGDTFKMFVAAKTEADCMASQSSADACFDSLRADADSPLVRPQDNTWYNTVNGFCQPEDPRAALAMSRAMGTTVRADDVHENGKVVATVITISNGPEEVSAFYYRGKARCEAALKDAAAKQHQEFDRYN